jgi:hypothetical protein
VATDITSHHARHGDFFFPAVNPGIFLQTLICRDNGQFFKAIRKSDAE